MQENNPGYNYGSSQTQVGGSRSNGSIHNNTTAGIGGGVPPVERIPRGTPTPRLGAAGRGIHQETGTQNNSQLRCPAQPRAPAGPLWSTSDVCDGERSGSTQSTTRPGGHASVGGWALYICRARAARSQSPRVLAIEHPQVSKQVPQRDTRGLATQNGNRNQNGGGGGVVRLRITFFFAMAALIFSVLAVASAPAQQCAGGTQTLCLRGAENLTFARLSPKDPASASSDACCAACRKAISNATTAGCSGWQLVKKGGIEPQAC
jgi:hypothetical protein